MKHNLLSSLNKVKELVLLLLLVNLIGCTDKMEIPKESKQNEETNASPGVHRIMSVDVFPNTDTQVLTTAYTVNLDMPCYSEAYYAASYEMATGGYRLLERLRSGENNYIDNSTGTCVNHDTYESWELTPVPRAIFNLDGSIKYYEFGLVENGYVTATITVNASKKEVGAIAYIFPYVLSYSHSNNDYFYIPNEYPHRAYYDGSDYRWVENPEIVISHEILSGINWEMFRQQATLEESLYMDSLFNVIRNGDADYDLAASEYWSHMEDALGLYVDSDPCNPLPNNSHRERNEYIESLKDYLGDVDCYCIDYTAENYCSPYIQQTYWNEFCGPSGLAWIYRGLYDKFPYPNGDYLPIHGDNAIGNTHFITYSDYSSYNFQINQNDLQQIPNYGFLDVVNTYVDSSRHMDNGLTAIFYSRCLYAKFDCWYAALLPCSLNTSFKNATNNHYGVSCDQTAIYAAEWIHTHNLPFMLLFTSLTHYLVAYGAGYTYNDPYNPTINRNRLYFLVTDNGYKISDNSYKPYWRKYKKCEYYYCIEHN